MAPDMADVKLLTPAECAALWRVDVKTVRKWVNAGKIPFIRTPGGHLRFREHEVLPLLKCDSPRMPRVVGAA